MRFTMNAHARVPCTRNATSMHMQLMMNAHAAIMTHAHAALDARLRKRTCSERSRADSAFCVRAGRSLSSAGVKSKCLTTVRPTHAARTRTASLTRRRKSALSANGRRRKMASAATTDRLGTSASCCRSSTMGRRLTLTNMTTMVAPSKSHANLGNWVSEFAHNFTTRGFGFAHLYKTGFRRRYQSGFVGGA